MTQAAARLSFGRIRFEPPTQSAGRPPSRHALVVRAVRLYTTWAHELLTYKKYRVHFVKRRRNALVWRHGSGDLRTLHLAATQEPFLVSVVLDGAAAPITARAAAAFMLKRLVVEPTWPRVELTVLPSEVGAALGWLLDSDTRKPAELTGMPFPLSVERTTGWASVWSQSAATLLWAARDRHPPTQK